jgi:hypothetical protein
MRSRVAERRPGPFRFHQVDQIDVDHGCRLGLAVGFRGLGGLQRVVAEQLGVSEALDPLPAFQNTTSPSIRRLAVSAFMRGLPE